MKNLLSKTFLLGLFAFLSGCAGPAVQHAATDIALTGAGGAVGYKISNGSAMGTVVGAAAGYVASKIVQSNYQRALNEAEKEGYDRAMNQAVKQQYWIIQYREKSRDDQDEQASRLIPVTIPESKINGVVVKAHVEYLRVAP